MYRRTGCMRYSYNKLWKMLIDRKITKTEMRKKAGISTNILAKMGRDESISMESLAKISTVLQCGLDDIVEIINDKKTEEI
jgi:putative transcriptional regulator